MEGLILMSSFGEYLRQKRESKGLTLNQTAMYSGISSAQLSRIENGKRGIPKPQTIKAISEALKIDYDELMQKAGYIDETPSSDKDDDNHKSRFFYDLEHATPEEIEELEEYFEYLKSKKKNKK